MLTLLLFVAALALGPQVVQGSFKFKFSPVVQCAPVSISFSGSDSNNHSVPTTLTILPLISNAVPIQIPIPNGASNSSGIDLSFIPLPAETTFVATLDAAYGPASRVSDITRVSAPNDTIGSDTCLLSGAVNTNSAFTLPTSVSQCGQFVVNFPSGAVAPILSAFNPKGEVRDLPVNAGSNVAAYTMNFERGEEVVLMLNDTATGVLHTSGLMTVQGDTGSPEECLEKDDDDENKDKHHDDDNSAESNSAMSTRAILPDATIIGIAIGAAVLVLFLMIFCWYSLRRRRRNKRASDIHFDPSMLNNSRGVPSVRQASATPSWYVYGDEKSDAGLVDQRGSVGSASFSRPSPGFVRDPLYTNDKWRKSVMTDDGSSVRTSISSWNQFIPPDQRSPPPPVNNAAFVPAPVPMPVSPKRKSIGTESRISMNTVDIQNILEMATAHQDPSAVAPSSSYSRRTPQPSTAGTTATFDVSVSKPAMARLMPNRRTSNSNPDLPYVAFNETGYGYGYAIGTPTTEQSGFPMPPFQRNSNSQRDTASSFGHKRLP
ncbi:hypothetical protein MKEN_00928900 [Mycena kentingensis (nom. inval.)]|nr:hypothetical protein MKEN_00928900 [Mycena kentingensis (nom. inval.)]